MKTLHIVPGTGDVSNGMVVVARMLAKEQGNAEVVDLDQWALKVEKGDAEEVWVHGMWLPKEWLTCYKALRLGKRLVRMTHGSLSPVYLKHQSPLKKRLVSPIERYLLRKVDKVIATCEAEADWIRAYEPRVKSIEVTDLKRFFHLNHVDHVGQIEKGTLHLLYLGRNHPLKGLEYFKTAVRQIQDSSAPLRLSARIISNASGKELDDSWSWCDVLILPTLSENFGLVIAEAIERGKRVITTDGAPAWSNDNDYGGRLIYLRGYRDGPDEERITLLKDAIESIVKE